MILSRRSHYRSMTFRKIWMRIYCVARAPENRLILKNERTCAVIATATHLITELNGMQHELWVPNISLKVFHEIRALCLRIVVHGKYVNSTGKENKTICWKYVCRFYQKIKMCKSCVEVLYRLRPLPAPYTRTSRVKMTRIAYTHTEEKPLRWTVPTIASD